MSLLLTQAKSWIDSSETLKTSSPTLHILYSICHNIAGHPSDQKLRSIKIENPKVKANILDVEGAIDLLYLCGFEMDTQTNCLVLKTVDDSTVRELNNLGNLFHSYCSDEVKSPKPSTAQHAHETTVIRHHDLFHEHVVHQDHPNLQTNISSPSSVSYNIEADDEYIKKQHELEVRKKQLAEEKRIKKEEALKIKNQSKLDRKEKHDEDEYEHGLNIPQHHATHHGQQSSNSFYSGMTTYKDLN